VSEVQYTDLAWKEEEKKLFQAAVLELSSRPNESYPDDSPFKDTTLLSYFYLWKLARESMRQEAIAICREGQDDISADRIEELL
jgi:hypothetical protein